MLLLLLLLRNTGSNMTKKNKTMRYTKIAAKRIKKKKNPFKFRPESSSPEQILLVKRHKKEARFRFYGILAISVSILFLVFLLGNIFLSGITALTKTEIR